MPVHEKTVGIHRLPYRLKLIPLRIETLQLTCFHTMLLRPVWSSTKVNKDRFDVREIFFVRQARVVMQRYCDAVPFVMRTQIIFICSDRPVQHPPCDIFAMTFLDSLPNRFETFHTCITVKGIFHFIELKFSFLWKDFADPTYLLFL